MGNTVGNNQSSVAHDYQLFNVVLDNTAIPDLDLNWNLLKLDQQCDHNSLRADSGTKE
ncbi:Hypothetical protein LCAKO_0993 [Lacticaseibacillus paracasei subsp. paracasei]|uniref:Uncharacterized protein n=1 Tax=Lacticaseibacillus paracasei subsp. paracasei TaxID=47714 RepID=A0AAP9HGU7_LACPA|nr:Hypothetical protein LCAKO_0993 [Lacticaseibacillus paracasei subsp. paracasei]